MWCLPNGIVCIDMLLLLRIKLGVEPSSWLTTLRLNLPHSDKGPKHSRQENFTYTQIENLLKTNEQY